MIDETKRTKTNLWLFSSGLIIIVLGLYVWAHPDEALFALAIYIGAILVISGIAYLLAFFAKSSSWYLALGLLNILVGAVFVININVTPETLPIMFAFWSIFVGIIQIASSYHYKGTRSAWFLTLISGVFGIFFGFLIMSYPFVGTIAISVLMGLYMVLYGALGMAECTLCWRRDED